MGIHLISHYVTASPQGEAFIHKSQSDLYLNFCEAKISLDEVEYHYQR